MINICLLNHTLWIRFRCGCNCMVKVIHISVMSYQVKYILANLPLSNHILYHSNDIISLLTRVMVTVGSKLPKGYHCLWPIRSNFEVYVIPQGYHIHHSFRGIYVACTTVDCLPPIAGREKLGRALLLTSIWAR